MPAYQEERLPCEPFMAWIEARVRHYEETLGRANSAKRVANDLGWNDRQLYRFRYRIKESKFKDGTRKTTEAEDFARLPIEEALFRAGVFLWEVYPDLPEYAEGLLPQAWCLRCQEEVFVDAGGCVWCQGHEEFRKSRRTKVAA